MIDADTKPEDISWSVVEALGDALMERDMGAFVDRFDDDDADGVDMDAYDKELIKSTTDDKTKSGDASSFERRVLLRHARKTGAGHDIDHDRVNEDDLFGDAVLEELALGEVAPLSTAKADEPKVDVGDTHASSSSSSSSSSSPCTADTAATKFDTTLTTWNDNFRSGLIFLRLARDSRSTDAINEHQMSLVKKDNEVFLVQWVIPGSLKGKRIRVRDRKALYPIAFGEYAVKAMSYANAEILLPHASKMEKLIYLRDDLPSLVLNLKSMWDVALGANQSSVGCAVCNSLDDEVFRCSLCLMSWHSKCIDTVQTHLEHHAASHSFGVSADLLAVIPDGFAKSLCALCASEALTVLGSIKNL